jgi:hypothetical protein
MGDDDKKDVFSEVSGSLGALFKRAKAAVEHVPTEKFEKAVLSSAHKVEEAAKHASEKVPMAAFESVVRSGARVVETAAKTAAAKMPADKIEAAVVTGVREVGRAIESVASTLQREVLGPDKHGHAGPKAEASPPEGGPAAAEQAGAPDAPPAGDPPTVLGAPGASASDAGPRVTDGASAPSADNPHEGI